MLACSPRSHEVTPRASAYALSRASRRRRTALFRLDKRYTLVYHVSMKRIEYYTHTNGKIPVKIWMKTLDVAMNKRIFGRLARIEEDDNFGDYKKIK